LLSGGAAIIAASLFGWLMWSLFTSPGRSGADPAPVYLGSAAFAVLVTASSAASALARGRPVPAASVLATLALGGLLPVTVFCTVWLALLYTLLAVLPAIFLVAPLALAYAGRRVIGRGRTALGTGLLLAGLLYTAGVSALLALALPPATWLPPVLWHLALAAGAITVLARDARRGPGPEVRTGTQAGPIRPTG
jgi:hypothetical protein